MEVTEEAMLKWEPQIRAMLRGEKLSDTQYNDLAQELRLTLIKALNHYDPSKGASFHTYLFRALQNKLKDFRFRTIKEGFVSPLEDHPNLQERMIDEDFAVELKKANLTTGEMIVLDLLLCGYNIREIGEICQDKKIPKRLLKRIRRKTMYMKGE